MGPFDRSRNWPTWLHYAVALGAIAVALLARWVPDPIMGDFVPFVTVLAVLLPLILLVRPDAFIVAATVGLVASWYLYKPPRFAFGIEREEAIAELAVFAAAVGIATFAAWLSYRRRQAERRVADQLRQALDKAEAGSRLLEALMRHVPDGVTVADADCNLRMVSLRGEEIIGGRLVGRSVHEVVRDWQVFQSDGVTPLEIDDLPLVRAINRGEVVKDDLIIEVNSLGEKLSLLCNASPIRDAEGVITGGVVVWRDITERHRAEQALRESEQRLQRAQAAGKVGVWDWDIKTDRAFWSEQTWATLNPHGECSDVTHDIWLSCIHPDDRDGAASTVAKAMETGVYRDQFRVAHAPDSWVESTGEFEYENGQPVRMVGTIRDITDRKRWEQERAEQAVALENALAQRTLELTEAHEAQRRTESLAMLGTLSTGIAHDLGNLLVPLRLRLERLRKTKLSDEVQEDVENIARNVEYINDLAARLRNTMAGAGKQQPAQTAEPLDLKRWCSDNEQFLRNLLPSHTKIECDVPDGLPLVRLNKVGLTQAVYNLVQNAVKAIHKSGMGEHIAVHCAQWQRDDAEGVQIAVEDDGPGMTAEVLARCMQPRFTTEVASGAKGLGLPLVKAFVEDAGGEIEVLSPPPDKPRGTLVVMRFAVRDSMPVVEVPQRTPARQ